MEKMVKQRKVSVSQFEAANREDLASIERAEIVVIQGYLPEKLDEATILAAIDDAIARTGASGPADMGKLMGVLKPKLAGQADMGQVSALVRSEEHTSELQSLMRSSYAVFCLKKTNKQ